VRTVVACLASVVAIGACTGDDGTVPSAPTGRNAPTVEVLGQNLELLPGIQNAFRVGFEPRGSSVDIIVTARPDTARITICPLGSVDDALPAVTSCRRDLPSGVRESVGRPGFGGVAIILDGDDAVSADLFVGYPEAGRALAIRMPVLQSGSPGGTCDDNACNPFFELRPTRGGPFDARATWDGPEATLVLLQGRVLGRAQTATGLPYVEAARADGSAPLGIDTTMSAPGEYALVFRHRAQRSGDDVMRDVRIDASWPG